MATIVEFIGKKVTYEKNGQRIWGLDKNDRHQLLLDLRGWGAIQNLFKDKKGALDEKAANKFQDELGEWIADAINQKLEKEKK